MIRYLAAAALLTTSAPALAQTGRAVPEAEVGGNSFTIAGGIGMTPDYEGSNDYRLIPAAFVRGHVGDISFTTRGLAVYVDAFSTDGNVDFDLGPIIGVRLNRTGKVKDDLVDALPERDVAIEIGGFAGVSLKGLTNPYDSLSLRLDVRHDIGGAHKSTVVSPNVDFATPLSQTFFASVSVGADFVSGKYADYYYGIDLGDALASGLATYDPDGGGMKSWNVGLLLNQSLSGDLRKGWSVFATGNHSRLVGDIADSPIIEDRGSKSQWLVASGLAYTW